MKDIISNLETTLDERFKKTPLAEVMCKINRMRDDVDASFLPQFDKYCHEVESILSSTSTQVLQDKRIANSVDVETNTFIRKSNLA